MSQITPTQESNSKNNSINDNDVLIEVDMRKCVDLNDLDTNEKSTSKKIAFEYSPTVAFDKTVKLKLVFPKKFLEHAKIEFDRKALDIVNIKVDDSINMLDIEPVYAVPKREKSLNVINNENQSPSTNADVEKVTSITSIDYKQKCRNMEMNPQKALPIMGKNALFFRCNINDNNDDYDIVKTLVEEKFSTVLHHLNEKASLRNNRKSWLLENVETATPNHEIDLDNLLRSYSYDQSMDSVSLTNYMNNDNRNCEYEEPKVYEELDFDQKIETQDYFDSQLFLQEALGENISLSSLDESLKEETASVTENSYTTLSPNSRHNNLIIEASTQLQIMLQTSKALNHCLKDKRLFSSLQQVEAERILLLATYRRDAILNAISNVQYDQIGTNGFVTIYDITFHLREIKKSKEKRLFVVIVKHEEEVFASDIIFPRGKMISLAMNKTFENLSPDFNITISLFCLKLKKQPDDIYCEKMEKKSWLSRCATFKKSVNTKHDANSIVRNSSFVCWGKTIIDRENLNQCLKLKLSSDSKNASVYDFVHVLLHSGIDEKKMTREKSGFLNFGRENGRALYWSKQWTCLDGCKLKCWNYPDEEPNTTPITIIDLRLCTKSEVERADRETCSKPRTLILEVSDKGALTRYFLAFDTLEDMSIWEKYLNAVLFSLISWSAMYSNVVTTNV